MDQDARQLSLPGFEEAEADWRKDYRTAIDGPDTIRNRSGIEVRPLYTPADWDGQRYLDDLGFPGRPPMTRGPICAGILASPIPAPPLSTTSSATPSRSVG